jgi:hypothetical protein
MYGCSRTLRQSHDATSQQGIQVLRCRWSCSEEFRYSALQGVTAASPVRRSIWRAYRHSSTSSSPQSEAERIRRSSGDNAESLHVRFTLSLSLDLLAIVSRSYCLLFLRHVTAANPARPHWTRHRGCLDSNTIIATTETTTTIIPRAWSATSTLNHLSILFAE